MRFSILFFGLLLLLVLAAFPVMVAGEENATPTHTTAPAIITGVTREIVTTALPTKQPTAEPTKEPTAAPTRETTSVPTKEPSLTPVEPQTGWVTIISTPSGALVTIDGTTAGHTPIGATELSSGKIHTIQLAFAGYEPYETTVQLTPLEHTSVDATLKLVLGPGPVKTPTPVPTTPAQPVGAGKGWIRVNCNVDGATVSFDQLSSGCTVSGGSCSSEVSVTGTPFKTFTVQKPGYQIYTGQITTWPENGQTIDLYATLNPQQSYGAIEVLTTPNGALVTLDGTSQQYSPASYSSVLAGTTHTIQVSAVNYQPYTSTVWVESGKSATVNAQLVPVNPPTSTGSVSVSSSPSGADIYVDGQYMAFTPSVIPGLAPGTHTIRLQKAGYDEFITTVRIVAGQRTPVTVALGNLPPTVGSIEVASAPTGASIYLDGTYMGQTQPNDYFDLTSLLQGSHTVTLRLADYQDYTHTVFVTGGQIVTVNAKLTPVTPGPVADTTGQITIVSTPPGANVFLDNTFRGITPVTLNDVLQGSHIIAVKQPGYNDAVQTVTVTGGQTTPVSISLGEAAATPTKKSPASILLVFSALTIAGICIAMRKK
ncbi:PEGA domain-containing protein [uncultured Methanoregula sp.]|uniref:PEGA domain-containing protein n=1 Tax=uncultured Methanoregula sp. TaxID=1005933 RepID=UPI002AAB6649|nr:PEGA domain-containing protein [uncultured Methanoregula sp.]